MAAAKGIAAASALAARKAGGKGAGKVRGRLVLEVGLKAPPVLA